MRGLSRFPDDDRGAAIVEFALVTPVLILVLVTCVDFSRALSAYVTVANASREGARYASVNPGADVASGPNSIQAHVFARVRPLDTSALDIEAFYDADGDGTATDAWPLGGLPASSVPVRTVIRVEVRYPWQAATSVVGRFFSATGQRWFTFSSSMDAFP